MEYIDHILTEEKSYRIRDPEAARVDNARVGGTVWDSRTLIDRLCPGFTVTGNPALCYPVEGYPLEVRVTLAATQQGEGTPTPENVRPIEPCSWLQLQHSNETASLVYDQNPTVPVWGGRYHWNTGILELTHKSFTIDENTELRKHPDGVRYYVYGGVAGMAAVNWLPGLCDSLPVITTAAQTSEPGIQLGMGNNYPYLYHMDKLDSTIIDVASLRVWLQTHPITFIYPLAEPELIQLNPAVIPAMAGENRLETPDGELTVTGRESLLRHLGGGQDV